MVQLSVADTHSIGEILPYLVYANGLSRIFRLCQIVLKYFAAGVQNQSSSMLIDFSVKPKDSYIFLAAVFRAFTCNSKPSRCS